MDKQAALDAAHAEYDSALAARDIAHNAMEPIGGGARWSRERAKAGYAAAKAADERLDRAIEALDALEEDED